MLSFVGDRDKPGIAALFIYLSIFIFLLTEIFYPLKPLSSLTLSILADLSFPTRKMTSCVVTSCPQCLALSVSLSAENTKQFYGV